MKDTVQPYHPVSLFSPTTPTQSEPQVQWKGLTGSALPFALAQAIKQHQDRLFVVVTPDSHSAQQLEQEIRFFLDDQAPVLHYPDWETLAYDVFSPLPEIISERLKTLVQLPKTKSGVLITPISTLMQRLAPRTHILAQSLSFKVGDRLDLEETRRQLEQSGYQFVSQVQQHGEFSVRGAILDLFPMASDHPIRVELFDVEIDSIRTFDPETQRSIEKTEAIELYPAREFPTDPEAIKRFRRAFRTTFPDLPTSNPLYQDVSSGFLPGGIEYYLPLFLDKTETLFSYLPEKVTFALAAPPHFAEEFFADVAERRQLRCGDLDRPPLPPEQLYLMPDELQQHLAIYPRIELFEQSKAPVRIGFSTDTIPDISLQLHKKRPTEALESFLSELSCPVLFTAESPGRREALQQTLTGIGLKPKPVSNWNEFLESRPKVALTIASLEQGLWSDDPPLALIPEALLQGEKVRQRRRTGAAREIENLIADLSELSIGAPVVHRDHGVGRYQGMQKLDVGGIETEFLTLEYAGGDKLYVPVSSLHLIGRYSGADIEHAPMHRLGGDQWKKAKRKAQEKIRDVAAELLEIHAKRAAREGQSHHLDKQAYEAFAADFPFEETPDQAMAIEAVLTDLQAPHSMDRVVCGDVGFGKTEVAMRAAFVAVHNNKQVAILVPTTLLAQQHYQNFRDRFADWPVRVEVLSRFVTAKKQKQILEDTADGKVDILIGTHKLIQKGVRYKNLGLVIIDEEQRFGVRQKEHFKRLRSEVDLLTLTATPIPRTLNMSLSGLRDISIIASPPEGRHPIQTFVSEWVDSLIQEAILREIRRGGQAYFVHNKIETMERMAEEIHRMVPEARIRIAHGQMPERELEQIMLDFYHQRFNVLLCTTIIESGIDIPSANTIVIHRADLFGLAQLHQLRGRVGRSHHRAYAYLIVPSKKLMTKDALKRLEAIEASGELGAGFLISSHDLEIRGAGELLGDEQSGQIQEIGFNLYAELLEKAVAALKEGKELDFETAESGIEIDLKIPALIPEDYLPDVHTRLVLYKRIANAPDIRTLEDLQVEMIDRFGLLPQPTKNLFALAAIKLKANTLGIERIDANQAGGRIQFSQEPSIDVESLLKLVQTQAEVFRLDGPQTLRFLTPSEEPGKRLEFIQELLEHLAP